MNWDRRIALVATAALTIGLVGVASAPASAAPVTLDVTDAPYSAVGDGVTNDRAAIQDALDDAGANPDGGTVIIPSGQTFLSGGVRIPSDVTLQIDGILKQSQNPSDYLADPGATPPIVQPGFGKYPPTGIQYDQYMFHNDPYVLSWGTDGAGVSGTGTIQMTWNGSEAGSLYMMSIGFLNATDFAVEDVEILGARSFNIAIYGSNRGVVSGTTIDSANVINTDGISVVNSQNVLVENNTMDVYDDGMYAVTRIVDPRDYDPDSWWTNRTLQPSKFVEFAGNHVVSTTRGVTFRGTINGVADLTEVETTDLWFHDNYLKGTGVAPVDCWSTSAAAPMSRYTFENNTYDGPVPYTVGSGGQCLITDFVNDFDVPSQADLLNGDFETTRHAWWSPSGGGGVYEIGDAGSPLTGAAKTAAASFSGADDFIGFLQNYGSGTAELVQGLGLGPIEIPATGDALPAQLTNTVYTLTATVQTSGDPIRMIAYDTCSNAVLGSRTVSASSPALATLHFLLPSTSCGNIRVGFDSTGASTGWALIDNVEVDSQLIDDTNGAVTYTGTWNPFNNTPAADIRGTRTIGYNVGNSMTIPFSGKRAWLYGVQSSSSGIVSIKVDGVTVGTVDAYSATTGQAQLLFDTGELAWDDHVMTVTITGKNPSSSNNRFGFDALLVDSIIDDNDTALVSYSGSWTLYTNTPTLDIKGTRHVGTTTGSTATITFDGRSASIYGSVGPTLGKFEVYLDGGSTPVATIDPYAASVVQGIELWSSGTLSAGSHTVTIKVTGTKNPASSGIRIGFDALLVG